MGHESGFPNLLDIRDGRDLNLEDDCPRSTLENELIKYLHPEQEVQPIDNVPRVLPKDEDPSMVKRNRRMLGQLLGTLEKFREEDKHLS